MGAVDVCSVLGWGRCCVLCMYVQAALGISLVLVCVGEVRERLHRTAYQRIAYI